MGSPITPELVYHLKTVSDPCLSPDGSKLAFTYSWVDPERLESCSRLMLLPLGPTETAGRNGRNGRSGRRGRGVGLYPGPPGWTTQVCAGRADYRLPAG